MVRRGPRALIQRECVRGALLQEKVTGSDVFDFILSHVRYKDIFNKASRRTNKYGYHAKVDYPAMIRANQCLAALSSSSKGANAGQN